MFNTPDIVEAPAGQDPRWQAIVARDRNFDGHFTSIVVTIVIHMAANSGMEYQNSKIC